MGVRQGHRGRPRPDLAAIVQHFRVTHANLSRPKFYEQTKLQGTAAGGRLSAFGLSDAKKKMEEIERGSAPLSDGDLRALELVMDIRAGCLDAPGPERDLEDWLRARRRAPKRAFDPHKPALIGGRCERPEDDFPASRLALLPSIQAALAPGGDGLRLLAVEGEALVGKSSLIWQWWARFGAATFTGTALVADCAALPGDQIERLLTDYLFASPQENPSPDLLVEVLNAHDAPLIVLDGLSTRRGLTLEPPPERAGAVAQIASLGRVQPTGADSETAARIRQLIASLAKRGVRASILLGVQSPAEDGLQLRSLLPASTTYRTIRVAPLGEEEAAHYLKGKLPDLSDLDRVRLARTCGGLPCLLDLAAENVASAPRLQKDLAIFHLRDADPNSENAVNAYLGLLESQSPEAEDHPLAFLRLLALMPGPTPVQTLEQLIAQANIRRLTKGAVERFVSQRLPFVSDLGDRVDVHPSVRSLIRRRLALQLEGGAESGNLSVSELVRIHLRALKSHSGLITSSAKSVRRESVQGIEAAIYHLLAVRDLLPETGPDTPATAAPGETDADKLQRIFKVQVSREELTTFALENVARRYLMNRTKRLTRTYGQFESKARILSYFLRGFDLEAPMSHVTHQEQRGILHEIGICWMYAGRLDPAEQALLRARGQMDDPDHEGRHWAMRADILSTLALIQVRRGRDAEQTIEGLEPDFTRAWTLVQELIASGAEGVAPELARPITRLILRRAQLELAHRTQDDHGADGAPSPLALFEAASVFDRRATGRPHLTGEAARCYAQALVRSRRDVPHALAQARMINNDQVGVGRPRGDARARRESVEIIAVLTTRAMLARVSEDRDLAREALETARSHDFVENGECPFHSRMELELEWARQRIAWQEDLGTTRTKLEGLCALLDNSKHMTLAVDARTLLAEVSTGPEKGRIIRLAQAQVDKWRMRLDDLDIVSAGGSAVLELGC